ncbi:hypothetical protein Tco_0089164 [Tanacetum coccineum]
MGLDFDKSYEHENGYVFFDISIGADSHMNAGISGWAYDLRRVLYADISRPVIRVLALYADSHMNAGIFDIFIGADSPINTRPVWVNISLGRIYGFADFTAVFGITMFLVGLNSGCAAKHLI